MARAGGEENEKLHIVVKRLADPSGDTLRFLCEQRTVPFGEGADTEGENPVEHPVPLWYFLPEK